LSQDIPRPEDEKLPAVPQAQDIEPEILDGQVVDESPPVLPLRVVRTVQVVIRHEHTQAAWRHLGYIGAGAAVTLRRLWDGRTTARYDRMLRSAEASGNHEAALDWNERRAEFVRDRHQRRMDAIETPVRILLAVPKIATGLFIVYALTGIMLAVASKHIAEVAAPFQVTGRILLWAGIFFSVTWGPLLGSLPVIALAALWHAGRTAGGATWDLARKGSDEDAGIVITADTVVLGLQHLPISELKKAFKDGWRPTFTLLPVKDGEGYSFIHNVPLGVTAEMIADQRPVMARNLHRADAEVWPTDAERAGLAQAGYVAWWVANRGVLDRPAPEYPLLHEGTADVFQGVPGGVIARGDGVLVPIVANNGVAGGQMGQGKSNTCRVIMLGCALDPLAELDVFVFANNGDFDEFAPRLARYRKGVEDDTVIAALNRLHELYAEVGRREGRLAELGAKKVTRQLAEQHPDLRPIVALFSECHELFGHPEYGAEAADVATKTAKRARKTAIVQWFDTQSSRKEAIPPKLVELVSVNVCFYVKTWRSNDGFLGDGSFQAGIRATELRPGRDVGRSVVTGISDAQFELVKWYYIEVDDDRGYDAATEVIARAMKIVAPGTPAGASSSVPAIETARNLLEDLAEVLGNSRERVRLADLPARLRKVAPHWAPYRSLTGTQLREQLEAEDVRTTNTKNVPQLDPADLRRALAERDRDE